jgi:pimeloyl-ACP methyl ester carboxylesterase
MLLTSYADKGVKTSEPGCQETPSTSHLWHYSTDALERVVVLGISAAGPTALQFAGRHPEHVSHLILQNAVTGAKFPGRITRVGAYVVFNRWTERWTWVAFRAFARVAPRRALTTMMGSLSSLEQLARSNGRHRLCKIVRYACLFDRSERTLGASGG